MFCYTRQSIQHNTDLTGLKAFMLYKKLVGTEAKIRKRRNQKKIPTNFLRCIGYLSFTKDHTKLDLLQILALVLPLNFLNY